MQNIKIGEKLLKLKDYGIITILGQSGSYRTSMALNITNQIVDHENDIIFHYDLCAGMTSYHIHECLSKENIGKYSLITGDRTIDDIKERIDILSSINDHNHAKVVMIIDTIELFSGCRNSTEVISKFSEFLEEYYDKIKNNNIYIIYISTLIRRISPYPEVFEKLNTVVDGLKNFNLYKGIYMKSNAVIKMNYIGNVKKEMIDIIQANILKYDNIQELLRIYGNHKEYLIGDSSKLISNKNKIKIDNKGRVYTRNRRTRVRKYLL